MKGVSARRKATSRLMLAFMALAVLLALVPLASILVEVAIKGVGAIKGLSFFTQPPPGDATASGGGIANAIAGTLIMVGMAALVFVPLGILGAVYLSEFASNNRLSRAVRFFSEVMTGVPSIMVGVFAYGLIVVYMHHFSALAGAFALGLIMWPIVLRTSEEMLRRVPTSVREASLALGTPKWRTVLKVVLPSAAAGLTTGSMLAIARAAGETAPLFFTALGSEFISFKITQPMSALPLEIYAGATSPYAEQVQRAWAAALTLIALVLALTLVARFVTARKGV
ncbi:MAG TPA: phosphate ABC transporter permease PstA [Actinomycetota bacterium]